MTSIEGTRLTAEDREVLRHPLIGGVIYFAQISSTRLSWRRCPRTSALRDPALVIAVDHEGGRAALSAMVSPKSADALAGDLWTTHAPVARPRAFELGFTIGHELGDVGVDFSFAPVLDLDYGESSSDWPSRHFIADPIITLATALMQGLRAEGMAAVGKHFPGRSFVRATRTGTPDDEP